MQDNGEEHLHAAAGLRVALRVQQEVVHEQEAGQDDVGLHDHGPVVQDRSERVLVVLGESGGVGH